MGKMDKLELEIIRFDTADVIATSGGSNTSAFNGLSISTTYFTLGSELIESKFDSSNNYKFKSDSFYKFHYSPSNDSISMYNNGGAYKLKDISSDFDYYAWYDNGGWYTEDLTKTFYSTWRIDNSQ